MWGRGLGQDMPLKGVLETGAIAFVVLAAIRIFEDVRSDRSPDWVGLGELFVLVSGIAALLYFAGLLFDKLKESRKPK